MSHEAPTGDFTIVGVEVNGQLIFEAENGARYVSGETLADFGEDNLTDEERVAVGLYSRNDDETGGAL